MPMNTDQDLRKLLRTASTIAMVGASNDPSRESFGVMHYLMQAGYHVIPVNPKYDRVLGQRCFPDVRSIGERVDIVDVFRRSDAVPGVVDDAIAAGAPAIWLQLGVVHPQAEQRAEQRGLAVVENRCIAIEHRRLMT